MKKPAAVCDVPARPGVTGPKIRYVLALGTIGAAAMFSLTRLPGAAPPYRQA